MDSVRLESYSKALAEEFADDLDTLKAMDRLVKTPRGEFEAKIPAMGDFLEMVREQRSARLRAVREAEERQKREAEERHRREHPEEYVHISEIYAEWLAMKEGR